MSKKLDFLQIGRAFAALIVVLGHITTHFNIFYHKSFLGDIFAVGWNGVDFFFVLSGFIIYYIHSSDIGKPKMFKSYMLKRLLRIYPIYWVIAVTNLIIIYFSFKVAPNSLLDPQLSNPSYIIKSLLLINQKAMPFVRVAWSLCYEIFFYLIFGLGVLFGNRILVLILVSYLFLFIASIFYINLSLVNNELYFFLSNNYHIEFLFGVLTAFIFQRKDKFQQSVIPVKFIWIFGFLVFISTWITAIFNPIFISNSSLASRFCYGLSSSIIIYGIANLKLASKNKIIAFFLLLGDASYSLYLIHPLILAIFFKLALKISKNSTSWIYMIGLIAFIICVLAGILIHKFIELNLLALLNKKLKIRNKIVTK